MPRTRKIRREINLNAEEERMLCALMRKRGLSRADVIRQLIRDAAARVQA